MKRSIYILLALAFIATCRLHAQGTSSAPYSATYSSNFTIGKPANAAKVLALYKDYENQDWSKDSWFADTVVAMLADGTVFKGKAEVLDNFKKFRAGFSSVNFSMTVFIPLKSVDRNEDWVAIWGNQTAKPADNSQAQQGVFNAVWRINKDGKVDLIHFFEAKMSGM